MSRSRVEVSRDEGGAALIRRLLESGLNLADIRNLWPWLTAEGEFNGCDAARAALDRHVARLEESISSQQQTLRHLRERQR